MVSSCMEPSCHARTSEVGQLLGIGLHGGEEITDLRDALDDGPDRPAVGPEIWVVQLVPGDRRGNRGTGRGPDGVRSDQSLDARVLRVVQPRPTLASVLRPLPRDEVRHGRTDRSGDLLHPGARVREVVAGHDRDPDLDAALAGGLRVAANADVLEGGPVEPREDERLVPGRHLAGVDVDVGEGRPPRVRQAAGPGVDLEARLVAEPDERRDAVGDEVVVRLAILARLEARLVPPCQPGRRGRRDVLMPEALTTRAIRVAMEVEWSILEVGHHRRPDPCEIADQLALGDRWIALEDRLVEVGELDVIAADLPDAFLAHGVEGRELGLRRAPGECGLRLLRRHVDLRWQGFWQGFGFSFADRGRRCDGPFT